MIKAKKASVERWNAEDAAELYDGLKNADTSNLVVFSRDWTVETMVRQIEAGSIDLDPDFQRRNAWRDARRSRLIESFMLNLPVPQVVLAEHPTKKKKFLVIDGKQRLMTLAGFFLKDFRSYWGEPILREMDLLPQLNGIGIDSIINDKNFGDMLRQLNNGDIRTAVISNYLSEDVLYDIFYRLNTGSVALSSQELRQVIHRGPFSKYLVQVTDSHTSLWDLLALSKPDARFRDVELLLRLISLCLFAQEYKGNLKSFLDNCMDRLNEDWSVRLKSVEHIVGELLSAISALVHIFGENAGRKFKSGRYETQMNRAIFEVQCLNLVASGAREEALKHKLPIRIGFEKLCERDSNFIASVEATTKSIENYRTRFETYGKMFKRITHSDPFVLNIG